MRKQSTFQQLTIPHDHIGLRALASPIETYGTEEIWMPTPDVKIHVARFRKTTVRLNHDQFVENNYGFLIRTQILQNKYLDFIWIHAIQVLKTIDSEFAGSRSDQKDLIWILQDPEFRICREWR